MKIKNEEVEYLAKALLGLNLKGKQSRVRVKFINFLNEYYQEVIQKTKQKLVEDFSETNDLGEIVYSEKYYEQLKLFNQEYLHVEKNEQNKDILLTIAEILLNDECEITTSGYAAFIFDNWCNELENTIQYYKHNSDNS